MNIYIPPVQASSCGGKSHVHNFQEMAEMYFKKLDLNDDDLIDKVEFEESKMPRMIDSFDVLQPDENGFVQKTDFIQNFIKAHSKPKIEV